MSANGTTQTNWLAIELEAAVNEVNSWSEGFRSEINFDQMNLPDPYFSSQQKHRPVEIIDND